MVIDATTQYKSFLDARQQFTAASGFDPVYMPDQAFDFQRHLIEWSVRMGRSAIFADCGLGKTLMQLAWAENVYRKTGKRVLLMTPLAVAEQTAGEAQKFGMDADVAVGGKADAPITISNYEKLHHFDPDDYVGVVCDESSILKSYSGKTRKLITRFMNKKPYRLLCTATAAPNDWIELGTSSEALGYLNHTDMLKRFFKYLDDKGIKTETRKQGEAEKLLQQDPSYYKKLSFRVAQTIGQWRLKHHAVDDFWRWVASWSRACRMPSDLGFSDESYILPELTERTHIIKAKTPPEGFLFNIPAAGLGAERDERRRTLDERVAYVASLVDHKRSAVVWCHMNDEGDALEQAIPDAVQVSGKTSDDAKVEAYRNFSSGKCRVLIIKPKIGAWGLNWQHCNHVVTFASHSYEQYYQSIRRCWRFGQTRPVQVDIVATEGEARVVENMNRKASQASMMFDQLVRHMNNANSIKTDNRHINQTRKPAWL